MRIGNIIKLIKHRGNVVKLLESYLLRLDMIIEFGSLTMQETDGLVDWINALQANSADFTVVEIGTLFGLTARELACRTNARIVAVDNFSWNPFGLESKTHEQFTRSVLKTSNVEIINSDSLEYLKGTNKIDAVFLDGDHSYEAVSRELLILKEKGVKFFSGHDWDGDFGVTNAVREVIGEPDYTVGRCWFKSFR